MIEKLTISKLKASGFNESQIENFKTNPQYEAYHYNKSGCFYASNKEKKIYSGSDATLLVYDKSEKNIPFPYWDKDFIPIYFETKKRLYIKEQKRVLGNNFIEKAANVKFKADEIQCIKNELNPFQLPERNVLFNIYLNWLYDLDSNLKPKPIRIYYAVKLGNIVNNFGSGEIGLRQHAKSFQGLNDFSFKTEIKSTPPEKIPEKLEFHLRSFERNGGEKMDWISHTKDLLPVNITPQQKDSFLCWIENAEAISNNLPPQQSKTERDKLKAPVLGLFCSLINKIGIDLRGETESAKVYCERICVKFKLPYTDRVRQNYNVNETKRLIQELTENVLPLIDNETKISVQEYFQIFR